MTARFNEQKLEILLEVLNGEETASGVAESIGITHCNASTSLARYWKQGLLNRQTAPMYNEKIYTITAKGIDRMNWLIDELESSDTEEDDLVECAKILEEFNKMVKNLRGVG